VGARPTCLIYHGVMSLLVIAIAVIVLLIFVTNTKRWRAVGSGLKKSKRDLENEIEELREPDH
jgi:uncharacterized protein YoxC